MSVQALTPDLGDKTIPAAYTSFKTFLSVIETLGQGIPKRIDRTMWRTQSGVIQSQIMMALRFFSLVDAPSDKRPEQIGALLRYAYHDIIEHDLTKMTPKMLDEAMENYHVNGDTKRKAVTFFLQAARFAELPMHPLLSGAIRNSSPRKRRSRRDGAGDSEELNTRTRSTDVVTTNQNRTPPKVVQLRSGGSLTLAIDVDVFSMSAEDRAFVFGVVDALQKYETGEGK